LMGECEDLLTLLVEVDSVCLDLFFLDFEDTFLYGDRVSLPSKGNCFLFGELCWRLNLP